jgi:phosphoserine phosphatase
MSVRQATVDDVMERCHRVARDAGRLRPGQARVAAVDADETLWKVDVASLLWNRLLERRALHPRAVPPLARALRSLGAEPARDAYEDFAALRMLRARGGCSGALMARAMLAGLAGMEEEVVMSESAAALAACPMLRGSRGDHPARMLEALRAEGFRVIVASSSPRWIVEIAARDFGIAPSDIVAGTVAVVSGRLTDDVIEPLPHGAGKLQAIMKRCGVVPHVAAGSALADLEMLAAASHVRLLVDPSDDLLEACEAAGAAMWFMRREAADLPEASPAPSTPRPRRAPTSRARRPRPGA